MIEGRTILPQNYALFSLKMLQNRGVNLNLRELPANLLVEARADFAKRFFANLLIIDSFV